MKAGPSLSEAASICHVQRVIPDGELIFDQGCLWAKVKTQTPSSFYSACWMTCMATYLVACLVTDPVCNKCHEINKLSVLCKDNGDKFNLLSFQVVIAAWTTASLGKAVVVSALVWIDIKQLYLVPVLQ